MDSYKFKQHSLSEKVLDYAAKSSIEPADLRKSKFGYNYGNMLSILERANDYGTATTKHLEVAEKLYQNIKKMPKSRREKIAYDDLKSRTHKIYSKLYSADLADERAQEQLQAIAAKKQIARLAHERKYEAYKANREQSVLEQVVQQAPAEKPGMFSRVANYVGNYLLRTAAIATLCAAMLSCGKKPEDKPADQPNSPVSAEKDKETSKPLIIETRKLKTEEPPFIGPKKQPEEGITQIPPFELPVSPYETEKKELQKTDKKQEEKPIQAEKEPIKQPVTTNTDSDVQIKGILKADTYFDKETSRYSGTGKAIIDFGKTGIDLYGTAFDQTQKFDDVSVDGQGGRFWAGAHGYLQLSDRVHAYLEAAGGYENRDFTINPENGNDFDFGNKGPFANLKLGITDGQLDDDDFGVGDKSNKLLFQLTKHWGDATGDVDGEYEALRAQVKARWMLDDDWSLEMGASYFREELGDFLKQRNLSFEVGPRWHFGKDERQTYIEALLLYRDLRSELMGKDSDDTKFGLQLGVGYRLVDSGSLAVDLGINAGWLNSRESDDEWFVAPSVTLYFGGKRKK